MIQNYFKAAINLNANDIHLSVGIPPVLRIAGQLVPMDSNALTFEDIDQAMRAVTPPRSMVELSQGGNTDFAYNYEGHRFRIAVFRQRGNLGMAMRHFRNVMFSLDELRIPGEVSELLEHSRGLFLITGPTGSGKTTTLASLVDHINSHCRKHIITIEDPVEIVHGHKKCVVTQREIGTDVATFAEGLRRSMRHDPDVIVVGEIRDIETTRIALKASETGHLVLGTLHSKTAASTITRIISQFNHDEQPFIRIQLAASLLGVINQTLIPTLDGKGLASAMEILINTHTVSSLIRQEKESQITDEIRKGKKQGMVCFEESLHYRCVNKDISIQEAKRHSLNPLTFQSKMEKSK